MLSLASLTVALSTSARAQNDQAADLAKQLSNPLAALISVPIQYNRDEFGGTNNGAVASGVTVQPVIPFSLNNEWNLISRTIVPFVDQKDFPAAAMNESGLGDITASLFFSPKAPTAGGWIWGAGPVMLLPTATQDVLGSEKWGLGPTAVVLKQEGPWSYGILGNHIWGVGGNDSRSDISATFVQPFLSYTSKTHTTFGVNSESSYDWKSKQWKVPLNFSVGQMFKVGSQLMQFQAVARYWADAPDNGPEGWGMRFQLTLLFPK
jgi:hypothetical protein